LNIITKASEIGDGINDFRKRGTGFPIKSGMTEERITS